MRSKKLLVFRDAFMDLFPGVDLNHLKYGNENGANVEWNKYHFNIPAENGTLKGSPYYSDSKSAVHFTSFDALKSILQDQKFRLYNLLALNDPREFTFASNVFKLNEKLIYDAKNNIYISSFCNRKILKKTSEEFNMWRLYGNNGLGVAIVFSLQNDPSKWEDFHFSNVKYGTDNRTNFKKIKYLLNNIENLKPDIELDLGKLFAFHKSKLFAFESELRLLYDHRNLRAGFKGRTVSKYDKPIFPIIKVDSVKSKEKQQQINYLEVPIEVSKNYDFENFIPRLKIESIKFGYAFGKDLNKRIIEIEDLCLKKLGYKPIVSPTRLRNFYWGK